MYHSIIAKNERCGSPWELAESTFLRQIDFLVKRGWRSLGISELVTARAWKEDTIGITFDDGLLNNFEACGHLIDRGLTASCFVVADRIAAKGKCDPIEKKASMNAQQLRELSTKGIEIGSHSVSHTDLNTLNQAQLDYEIVDSKKIIEDTLGIAVKSFAYPYGRYSDKVVETVAKAGYEVACTTRSGWALASSNALTVHRLTVFGTDSLAVFKRNLQFRDNEMTLKKVVNYYCNRIIKH
jgi:peptidoglycan/xylan/chitin deacetylase (PgdA/CDA1 family)